MFCFLVMMFALALSQNLFDLNNYTISLRLLVFYAMGFVLFELIIIYNKKNSFLEADAKSSWFDLLYISVPFVIATIALL